MRQRDGIQRTPEETGKRRAARLCLLAAAALLTVLGILNGGMQDVLTKAVWICTECIGLG
ncbi:MAG: hypothetical protein IJJ42_00995 [Clostridia bacterium]|nr:hypothetical protein [Clostridia bacterium]